MSSDCEERVPSGYAADLLQSLFKSEAYFDVTIKVSPGSGRSWRVHKCVLATASKYFDAMFSGHFKESSESEILLNDIPNDETLEMVLLAVYGGALRLDESNVLGILRISNLLQFNRIENECWEFILSRMEDEFDNSQEVLALADQLGQIYVYEQALHRVAYNFRHIRLQPQFQELDANLLFKLLSSDELRVNSEEDVVAALLDWINCDKEMRMRYLTSLIQAIRIPLLTKEFLSTAFAGLELCQETRDFLEKAPQPGLPPPHPRKTIFGKIAAISFTQDKLQVHVYCPVYKKWIKDVIKSRSDSRHIGCFVSKHTLYSFATMIKEFDLASDSWNNFTWFRMTRYDFACARMDNELYVIGGRKLRIERVVTKVNLVSKVWTRLADLNVERELAGAVSFQDEIYVLGGRTNDMILNLVECYDPVQNVWKYCQAMIIPRMTPEVVQCGGRIYAFGGFQGIDIRLFVTNVEMYNTDTDTWELCGEIGDESKTYSVSVTVFNDQIYCMLDNENHCQFGIFDPKCGELNVLTFVEKVIDKDHLDLSYCTIHGVPPLLFD